MRSGDLVVKNHEPLRHKLWFGGLAAVALVLSYAAYELGVSQGGHLRAEAQQTQDSLQQIIDDLNLKLSQQQEQITILKRTKEIDGQAYNAVRDDVLQQQAEMLELRQEVEFYRGIVSPTERQAGINIQTFKLQPVGEEEALFHYELVLTQVLKNDRFVKGGLSIKLHGVQDDSPKVINFKTISPNNSVGGEFRFRYFQKFEGDIRLPEGFIAREVEVEMRPKGRKVISRSFPWQLDAV